MDSKMGIESVSCEYAVKKEATDGDDIKSHYDLTTRPEEFDCVVELEPIHDPSDEDANSKIEIKSILDKHYVKEEADADNVQSSSLQGSEIKNEFEQKACPRWDQTENEAGQNTEGSHNTDMKGAILDENHIEFKLESISDEEAIENEIDEPDLVSFEDFNTEQEDLDYKKNETILKNTTQCETSREDHNPKKYNCEKCKYWTYVRQYFIRHIETHKDRSERKLFNCTSCGRTFTMKVSLELHKLLHLDPKDRPTYGCDICNYRSIYKFNVQKHKLIHTNRGKSEVAKSKTKRNSLNYKSNEFSHQTDDTTAVRRDEETYKARSNKNLFDCLTCGRTFTQKSHFERHMLLHMDPKEKPTYDCDLCDYKTILKCRLKEHKLRHANRAKRTPKFKTVVNTYKCDQCSYHTGDRSRFRIHKQTHKDREERNLFECATCGRTYTSKHSLERHVLLHMDLNKRPTYDCDLCSFKTIYKSMIKKHKLRHAIRANPEFAESKKKPKRHKCDKCSYQTENCVNLRRHKQTHETRLDRNLFDCSTCGRTYTTEAQLKQHMVLHMDPKDRPTYNCDVCDYKTIYKSIIKKHKLKHAIGENSQSAKSETKPKRHKCDKCSYQTHNSVNLRRHQQTHEARSDRSLFECSICYGTYTTRTHLKQHMLLHMDPKDQPTYDCDMCEYKTIYKSIIKKHKLRHAIRENPELAESKKKRKKHEYKCDKCSYQTDICVNLKRHEQTHKSRSDRDLFECATCGRTYTSKRSLEQHVSLHMDLKIRPT